MPLTPHLDDATLAALSFLSNHAPGVNELLSYPGGFDETARIHRGMFFEIRDMAQDRGLTTWPVIPVKTEEEKRREQQLQILLDCS